MAEFDAKKFGSVVCVPFTLTNATTGNSNTDLKVAGGENTLFVAPTSGSIIAITAACQALTAGTITLTAHKASTEFTQAGMPVAELSSTADTNGAVATAETGAVRFAAGDTLGISAVSTTTLNPTNTADVEAFLFIQLDA
jgi:acyl-CoA synthetase (NDP forming)